MKYILALDQGTTSSRAIIFDKSGKIISKVQTEFAQIYPRSGWVEHNPHDILNSCIKVAEEALFQANLSKTDISAIGITNQRETTIVWNRDTGEPIYNAIVWQCRRTADISEKLIADGFAERIYNKTGLVPDAYFSATKIKWILDNVEGARSRAEKGELCFGTVDTYLLFRLSQGKIFATDYTNASRTMLFNIHTLEWDKELLRLFDIPESMLPEVHPSSLNFGKVEWGALKGIDICGVAGDQQAALFGQLCTNKGDIKNTYGTGCFLLMNTGDKPVKSSNGLITTLGATENGTPCYVLEGSVFVGGAVVQWLRDGLKIIKNAASSERAAKKVKDSGGVYLVPAFTGLGAPYWDSDARGTICGITRGTTKNHIIRAALESIAYQVHDIVAAMERDAGVKVERLSVDGGASANNFLMNFQADILGCSVACPEVVETTALGAAYIAGLNCGYWKDTDEIRKNRNTVRVFSPSMDEGERLKLLDGWKSAVEKARLK